MPHRFHADSALTDSVQILDLSTGLWRISEQTLPEPLYEGAVVEWEDAFIIVGGYSFVSGYQTRLIQFDPDSEGWNLRPEILETGRSTHMAVLVDSSKVVC